MHKHLVDARPPSKLVKFTIKHVPATYANDVVNRSTLVPVYGVSTDLNAYKRKCHRLVKDWRALVTTLSAMGWGEAVPHDRLYKGRGTTSTVGGKLLRCLNCRPSAFVPSVTTDSCRVASLCPHCHGRRVLDAWREVDRRLFGGTPPGADADGNWSQVRLTGTTMLSKRQVLPVGFGDFDEGPLAGTPRLAGLLGMRTSPKADPNRDLYKVVDRRTDHRKLLKCGVVGGLDWLTVSFRFGPKGKPVAGWWLVLNQVVFVPTERVAEVADPGSWFRSTQTRCVVSKFSAPFPSPTRATVMRQVAEACKYPRSFLYADPSRLFEYADAVRGRPTFTRFGSLYGKAEHA